MDRWNSARWASVNELPSGMMTGESAPSMEDLQCTCHVRVFHACAFWMRACHLVKVCAATDVHVEQACIDPASTRTQLHATHECAVHALLPTVTVLSVQWLNRDRVTAELGACAMNPCAMMPHPMHETLHI